MPEIVVSPGTLEDCDFLIDTQVDAIAVGVGAPVPGDDELQPRAGTVHASARYRIDLAELAERAHFSGAAGATHVIDLPRVHAGSSVDLPWRGLPLRIILVGVGQSTHDDITKAGASLGRVTRGLDRVVTTVAATGDPAHAHALAHGYWLAAPQRWSLAAKEGRRPADQLVLLTPPAQVEQVEELLIHAEISAWSTWLSRDLSTVPANYKTPQWLADTMRRLAKEQRDITVTVRDATWLAKNGWGGVLAVGGGSISAPLLVEVTYRPAGAHGVPVVLVGKGVTFDTGGISIKRPRESMIPMKTDMMGAASAFAAVLGASRRKVNTPITALLPLAENHFGANSYRPGDVVTLVDGTQVDVKNTDAEGRLILADALAYATKHLSPSLIIDVATLTGAAALSLGRAHGALYGNTPDLVTQLRSAGERSGEKLWPMPLVSDYNSALESDVADVVNLAPSSVGAGSVTAALFLQRFVGETPWAHLDIAGPSLSDKDKGPSVKGPTGYGARLLVDFLVHYDKRDSGNL